MRPIHAHSEFRVLNSLIKLGVLVVKACQGWISSRVLTGGGRGKVAAIYDTSFMPLRMHLDCADSRKPVGVRGCSPRLRSRCGAVRMNSDLAFTVGRREGKPHALVV